MGIKWCKKDKVKEIVIDKSLIKDQESILMLQEQVIDIT